MIRQADDVHIRVGRLVVDQATLDGSGIRGLREAVARQIAQRFESPEPERDPAPGSGLSEAIAAAVADRVSPRVDSVRRR